MAFRGFSDSDWKAAKPAHRRTTGILGVLCAAAALTAACAPPLRVDARRL